MVERVGKLGIYPSLPRAVIGVPRPDSAAYRAGLRTFDVVILVGGKPIKRFVDLETALRDNRGENMPVTYLRPRAVDGALGGLVDGAVYEPGVANLTPDPAAGDLLVAHRYRACRSVRRGRARRGACARRGSCRATR